MKIRIIGDVKGLPKELQDEIRLTEDATRDNPGLTFSIALNYGGRDEIIRAVRSLLQDEDLRKRIEEEGVEKAVDEALISASLGYGRTSRSRPFDKDFGRGEDIQLSSLAAVLHGVLFHRYPVA